MLTELIGPRTAPVVRVDDQLKLGRRDPYQQLHDQRTIVCITSLD
jgi:hypothetical protein